MTEAITSAEVRAAKMEDVEAIARLAGELGYPATAADVRKRLDAIAGDPRHALFVAVDRTGTVVGWIQLSEERSVVVDPRAEITGLVVDSASRSLGVGRVLVERGENWARSRGLGTIGLRSNVIRERAHEFYVRLGYKVTKSQKVFRKSL
jgi:ribosomal protein S18 acetylase RimI-like enzyme